MSKKSIMFSYNHNSDPNVKEFINKVTSKLKTDHNYKNKFNYFHDSQSLQLGNNIDDKVYLAIKEAEVVIIFNSDRYYKSISCRGEAAMAYEFQQDQYWKKSFT